jgi:cysteinyl-tRNA synthetase
MSKSLGNLVTNREALERYSADALRIFVLSSHYRSPITYSEETLEAAERGAERLALAYSRTSSEESAKDELYIKPYEEQFIHAMDDDFNTARALSRVFELAAVINRAIDSDRNVGEAKQLLKKLACDILGLTLKPPERPDIELNDLIDLQGLILTQMREEKLVDMRDKIAPLVIQQDEMDKDAEDYIRILKDIRNVLRKGRHFQLADRIRDRLDELGITLEDKPEGTEWRRKR